MCFLLSALLLPKGWLLFLKPSSNITTCTLKLVKGCCPQLGSPGHLSSRRRLRRPNSSISLLGSGSNPWAGFEEGSEVWAQYTLKHVQHVSHHEDCSSGVSLDGQDRQQPPAELPPASFRSTRRKQERSSIL